MRTPATSAPGLGHPCHICTGTGLTRAIFAGPGSLTPHMHRDCAHHCPHLHQDWAHPCHICTGTALAAVGYACSTALAGVRLSTGPHAARVSSHPLAATFRMILTTNTRSTGSNKRHSRSYFAGLHKERNDAAKQGSSKPRYVANRPVPGRVVAVPWSTLRCRPVPGRAS